MVFPFFHMKKASAAKIRKSTRTLSGATRLHEVGSYVIVVAFTSPPLLGADSSPLFFSTNRLATRLNPTSSGRFTLLFYRIGSARPFGCAALKARVSLYLPLRYLRSAKTTPILAVPPWLVRSTVQSFDAQSLSYRPLRSHSFGAQALATVLTRPHSFGATKP